MSCCFLEIALDYNHMPQTLKSFRPKPTNIVKLTYPSSQQYMGGHIISKGEKADIYVSYILTFYYNFDI